MTDSCDGQLRTLSIPADLPGDYRSTCQHGTHSVYSVLAAPVCHNDLSKEAGGHVSQCHYCVNIRASCVKNHKWRPETVDDQEETTEGKRGEKQVALYKEGKGRLRVGSTQS